MTAHPATIDEDTLLKQCQMSRRRDSGPGGQHRNKVETAVVYQHVPTGIRGEATERRSQAANREQALFRLRVNLALQVRQDGGQECLPSNRWRNRVRGRKIEINPAHTDFPALLSEALDVIAAFDWDAKAAAETLAISSTQLIRLLKLEPRALTLLNQHRAERDLHPYR